ncbi:MAG: hypothetical protein J6T06_10510 [Victivallales bacterium]|nr:hypothetical protein [Victivallales bacterium]
MFTWIFYGLYIIIIDNHSKANAFPERLEILEFLEVLENPVYPEHPEYPEYPEYPLSTILDASPANFLWNSVKSAEKFASFHGRMYFLSIFRQTVGTSVPQPMENRK